MEKVAGIILCGASIILLFVLDRDRSVRTSRALWLPFIWFSLVSSRSASRWLAALGLMPGSLNASAGSGADASPIDQLVFLGLTLCGIAVLLSRTGVVSRVLNGSYPLFLYWIYGGVSLVWSNYMLTASKLWLKMLCDLVMVLVVVTERDPKAAVLTVLKRVGFVLIPLSVLLIVCFPAISTFVSPKTNVKYIAGVATYKNELGAICLVYGFVSVWYLIIGRLSDGRHERRHVLAHWFFLAMAAWLFWTADTMTGAVCLVLGAAILLSIRFRRVQHTKSSLNLLTAVSLAVPVLILFIGVGLSDATAAIGRDGTLTGRTGIWKSAIAASGNPVIGVGFQSFWYSDPVTKVLKWNPGEAHNGYLETYLSLGFLGLMILALVLIKGQRRIVAVCRGDIQFGSFLFAWFIIALVYNLSESAFRAALPVWILFATVIMLSSVYRPASDRGQPERSCLGRNRTAKSLMTEETKSPVVVFHQGLAE